MHGEILREVMSETGTTQSQLSRMSGVKQPSVSQFLSGRTPLSDAMLDRLMSCMGYRVEVVRRPMKVELNRSTRRRWELHRRLSMDLTEESLQRWLPVIVGNLQRLRNGIQGQPHLRNLDRWEEMVQKGDVPGLRRVMTGLDTDLIQMREVSPLGGLLSQEDRSRVLESMSR